MIRSSFLIVAALALLSCDKPKAPLYLAKVSGDNQMGIAGQPLSAPFIVKVTDNEGNGLADVTVAWSVLDGDGNLSSANVKSGPDGTLPVTATLGPLAATNHFQAAVYGLFGSPIIFTAARTPFKLAYTDPGAAGKLRFVKSAATDTSVTLDLVVAAGTTLSGYSAGFNLPVDAQKIALDSTTPLMPGQVLNPGSEPVAAMAALPTSGPLASVLVSGQSQKASGKGAVTTDSPLPPGSRLYSIKLALVPTATPGIVFDGTASGFSLRSGGIKNRAGTAVVNPNEISIGKLEVVR